MQCFDQHYKSEISDKVFNIIPKELNVNGNICHLLEKYSKFLNKYERQCAKEFDSNYDPYRDFGQEKKLIILTKNLTCYQFIKTCLN